MAVDVNGNVYLALIFKNQIWKIDTSGHVTVIAGTGTSGPSGDGGPAINAVLNQPSGLALDSFGNLFFTDFGRVRKISNTGVISTVAGGGSPPPGSIGDGGPATAAQFNYPVAVAVDAMNNLYIADRFGHRVRVVSATTGIISTFAGVGNGGGFSGDGGPATSAELFYPCGLALDSAGAVYIADCYGSRVRKVSYGLITTVAGSGSSGLGGDGGLATGAQLQIVTNGLAVDRFDNLFILGYSSVRKVASGQLNITTFAGGANPGFAGDGGTPATAFFRNLAAIAIDSSSSVYLGDNGNYRIRKLSPTLTTTVAGNGAAYFFGGEGQQAVNAIIQPGSIQIDQAGNLCLQDSYGIKQVALGSGLLTPLAGNGMPGFTPDGNRVSGSSMGLIGFLTCDSSGTVLFTEGNRIRKIKGGVVTTVANSVGVSGVSGDGGSALNAQFMNPLGLALASNGDIYVADSFANRIRLIKGNTGIVTTIAGTGVAASSGDGGPAVNANLDSPIALSLDGNGNLFVSETYFVRKINLSTNIITTIAGDASAFNFRDDVLATTTSLLRPNAIFADQSGNIFISDSANYRVRKVSVVTGFISTVAGNGSAQFSGDGGSATAAGLQPSGGLTLDQSQNLYISDTSGRIRMTQVSACFFTLSTPTLSIGPKGGTGSLAITATNSSCPYSVSPSSSYVTITNGNTGTGSGTIAFSVTANTGAARTATVSLAGQSFTITQPASSPQYNVGFFQPSGPQWVLDSNGNGVYDAADKLFPFAGQTGAIAVVGDWNGDGHSKVGYYLNGFWALDYNGNGVYDAGVDKFYAFGGGPGYIPVVGDWNGDGRTKIGYYHDGFWALDTNGNGTFDAGDGFFGYGGRGPGEVPIVGDWNGDHRTKIGFFFNGTWVLDYDGNGSFGAADKYYSNFTYAAGDKPVVGDWNGDGTAKIGIYRGGFWILDYNGNGSYDGIGPGADKFYGFGGNAGETPLVADWNGDGKSKIGVYLNGFWELDFNGNGSYDGTGVGGDRFLGYYGGAGSQPIIGRW